MQKLSTVLIFLSFSLQAQISFDSLTWDDALKQSKTSGKLVFVHASASWCQPCREMEEYVFSDLEVGNFYNKNFVNIQLDMEQYPGVELAEKYAVGVYPTFLYVNQYGEVVHRGCGAMDTADFLALGETAIDDQGNLAYYEKTYLRGEQTKDVVMNYLALMESACLDAERFAGQYLNSVSTEELTSEAAWSVFASYNWDIYTREFLHLLGNQAEYEKVIDPIAVQTKIYDTYLVQYQEIYEAEELHGFGMRSLIHSLNQATFSGVDTLKTMMNLHYAEYTEDWEAYATNAIEFVGMMQVDDSEQLGELAWQFYLFVDDKNQLEIASGWVESAMEDTPDPSLIDTYASLQYKLGNKKKAVELSTKALELAKELYDDTEHFEYQLKRFKGE